MRIRKLARHTALVLFCATSASLNAENIYGLTDAGVLFRFDSSDPANIIQIGPVQGVKPLHLPRAIDFRPLDNRLYLLSTNGADAQLYALSIETAGLKQLSSSMTLGTTASGRIAMDFDPVTDQLRIITGDGQSFRADPESGALISRDSDILYAAGQGTLSGSTPNLAGIAYSNNFTGASSTTLYGYDFTYDHIATVGSVNGTPVSPNSGMLFDVGLTGVMSVSASIGMDISVSGVAYLNAEDGSAFDELLSVNLATGECTSIGEIGDGLGVLDISAEQPEPSSTAILAAAGWNATRRRRVTATPAR